jgi:hypothetical protein
MSTSHQGKVASLVRNRCRLDCCNETFCAADKESSNAMMSSIFYRLESGLADFDFSQPFFLFTQYRRKLM